MAKITEITYSRGQTIQLKAYEPVNVHYSIKAEVDEKENITRAFDQLEEIVDSEVTDRVKWLEKDKFNEEPKKPYKFPPKTIPDGEVKIEEEPF